MAKQVEAADLIAQIDERLQKVRTRALDISFNELLDMKANDELTIEPEYQRLFRWDEVKQSRFIESVLLEMPIPPIYVIELDDNKYELIDGLQRVSTWMHFRGQHPGRKDESGEFAHLMLNECDIVPALNGLTYETLPSALKIKLKRHFIRVEVIRKESDARLRYYMFKRLNTGGEQLSEQEVRNCTIRLLDPTFSDLIAKLATDEAFVRLTDTLSDNKKDRMYREELILRFFALKNDQHAYEHIVGEFLTAYLEKVSDPKSLGPKLDLTHEEDCFRRTCRIINAVMGERAFSTVTPQGTITSTFSVLHFEALMLGLQDALDSVDEQSQQQMDRLGALLTEVKKSDALRKVVVGGGQNYAGPHTDRVRIVATQLKDL